MPILRSVYTMDSMKDLFISVRGKFKLPLTIHILLVTVPLLLHSFNIIFIDQFFLKGLTSWVSFNLLILAFRPRFITPEVVNLRCPICKTYMSAIGLKCPECGGTFDFK